MRFQQKLNFAALVVVAGLLLTTQVCFSQSIDSMSKKDSLPKKVMARVADRFPSARMLNLEYSQVAPYRYAFKPSKGVLPKNKVTNQNMVKVNANISLVRTRKWIIGAALNYRYMGASAESPGIISGGAGTTTKGFHYHSTAINATYISTLFHKMMIYSGSVALDGSEQHFERFKGRLSGTLLLKANAQTKIMVGVSVILDPSSQIPALPIFSYEHRFTNGLMVDVLLPQRILLKKDVFTNGRLSLGAEMNQNNFYLYRIDSTNRRYEFRQTELNSGFTYEQLIGKSMSAFIKTGIKTSLNANIFKKSESANDYVFEAKPNAAFYVNVGFSINPFAKPRKQ